MRTILVADDDRTCRDSMQKVLQREGYAVQTAENVDEALEAVGSNHFDLIVCDYRMPEKTGLDLLIELRRRHCAVPVLMVSAYADAIVEAKFCELGGVDILRKPIRRQELIQQTSRAFDRKAGQRVPRPLI